ncbi:SHOCT domain-containing protein [Nonomuraea sp. PA05]|uniref:SHOCT domain-containing protein n=1 Tax=Nonomuraea sp. PA05 TaxID=2604466 RepID=UPI0011DA3FF2|nr:SHOCT domain-containing protein [Nonomuraea sp. PA05]TYB70122.1 SHOCT domain-containing protein [Nonomuraea sp. PA05]
MGLLYRRRRPLRNAAMLAGAGVLAYQAGKRQAQETEYGQDPYEPSGAEPSGGGMADQLERLKALLDQGAISEEEYRAAKQQVLTR